MSGIDDHLREELGALLDGALPAERAAELRRRLETDAELRREYEELRRTVEAVRGLPRESAPPELRERLRQALPQSPPRGRVVGMRWLPAAAAAVLVVGVTAALLSSGRDQQGTRALEAAHREEQPSEGEAFREAGRQDERAPLLADEEDGVAGAKEDRDDASDLREVDAAGLRAPAEKRAADEKGAAAQEPSKEVGTLLRKRERAEEETLRPTADVSGEKDSEKKKLKSGKNLLVQLEKGERLAPADRGAYFLQLQGLELPSVQAHIGAVARSPSFSTVAGAAANSEVLRALLDNEGAPPREVATVRVADAAEAQRMREILRRAYPVRALRGRKPQGPGARVSTARSTKTADMVVEIEVEPKRLPELVGWLYRLETKGTPAPGAGAGGDAGGKATGAQLGGVRRKEQAQGSRRVKIRIRYGDPVPPPSDPAAAQKDKKKDK